MIYNCGNDKVQNVWEEIEKIRLQSIDFKLCWFDRWIAKRCYNNIIKALEKSLKDTKIEREEK